MVPRLEISGQIEQVLNRVQFFFPLQIERAHCLTAHPSLIHRLGNETVLALAMVLAHTSQTEGYEGCSQEAQGLT